MSAAEGKCCSKVSECPDVLAIAGTSPCQQTSDRILRGGSQLAIPSVHRTAVRRFAGQRGSHQIADFGAGTRNGTGTALVNAECKEI